MRLWDFGLFGVALCLAPSQGSWCRSWHLHTAKSPIPESIPEESFFWREELLCLLSAFPVGPKFSRMKPFNCQIGDPKSSSPPPPPPPPHPPQKKKHENGQALYLQSSFPTPFTPQTLGDPKTQNEQSAQPPRGCQVLRVRPV